MTKKHFESLAAELKAGYAELVHIGSPADRNYAELAFRDAVNIVANVCADANPRFDRARFLAACGIN